MQALFEPSSITLSGREAEAIRKCTEGHAVMLRLLLRHMESGFEKGTMSDYEIMTRVNIW